MRGLALVFFFIFFSDFAAGILINEIMYNPNGTDEGREWIEIYNNDNSALLLEPWSLFENNASHTFTLVQGTFLLEPLGFAILADDAAQFLLEYPAFSGNLYDTTWGSLGNTGEILSILDESERTQDFANYTSLYGDGNGKSSERFYYGWNESNAFGGSPGRENNATLAFFQEPAPVKKGVSLSGNLDTSLYLNVLYDSLFVIENLDHTSGITDNISLILHYSITLNGSAFKNESIPLTGLNQRKTSGTGSFIPNQTGIYSITGTIENISIEDPDISDNAATTYVRVEDTSLIPCNVSLSVEVNDTFYEMGESIEFDFETNDSFPFMIEYWVEDLFNSVYKSRINTSNLNEKSWKTKIDEQDRALFIKANLFPGCDDISSDDNSIAYLFIVTDSKGNDAAKSGEEGSALEIIETKDAVFGESAQIEVSIYKGDTRKYSIQLWAEDDGKKISEVTKLKMPDKFSSFEGTLPIQLFDSCEKGLEDGRYEVVIEGLGLDDEERIDIDAQECDSDQPSKSAQSGLIFQILNTTVSSNSVQALVLLRNNQNIDRDIDLWSYVYRGSKSYSGEREANKESFMLSSNEEKMVILQNTAAITEPGMYKLKVLLNKDNQRTNQDITQNIEFSEQLLEASEQTRTATPSKNPAPSATASILPFAQSALVYESNTQKAKNTTLLFIAGASIVLNLIFLFRL